MKLTFQIRVLKDDDESPLWLEVSINHPNLPTHYEIIRFYTNEIAHAFGDYIAEKYLNKKDYNKYFIDKFKHK